MFQLRYVASVNARELSKCFLRQPRILASFLQHFSEHIIVR